MSKIIEKGSGLRLIQANDGLLLFKKKDTNRSYFTEAYMAKNETEDDYGEVTYDYAYGMSNDKEYIELKENYKKIDEMLILHSNILDMLLFPDSINGEAIDELAKYVSLKIINKKLDYDIVIQKYPNLKEKIDKILNK